MAFNWIIGNTSDGDLSGVTTDSGNTFTGSTGSFTVTNGEMRCTAGAGGEKVQVNGYTTSTDTSQRAEVKYKKDSNLESQWWLLFGGTNENNCYGLRIRIESGGTTTLNLWRFQDTGGSNQLLSSTTGLVTSTGFEYTIRIDHTPTGVVVYRQGGQELSSGDTTFGAASTGLWFRGDATWGANTGLQIQQVYQEVLDEVKPVITITGDNPLNLALGDAYSDPVGTWTDNVDGSGNVTDITGDTVDVNTVGTYQRNYNYTDTQGNVADTVTLTVAVFEPVNIPKTYPVGVYPLQVTANALNGTTDTQNSTMSVTAPLSVDSFTSGPYYEGTSVTVNMTGASGTDTLSIPAGAVPIQSQDTSSLTFLIPNLRTLGDKTSDYNTNITFTVDNGSSTDTFVLQVTPTVGWEVGPVASIAGFYTEPEFAGLVTGDLYYVESIAGADFANGYVPPTNQEQNFPLWIQDQTDGVWGTQFDITIPKISIDGSGNTFVASFVSAGLGETNVQGSISETVDTFTVTATTSMSMAGSISEILEDTSSDASGNVYISGSSSTTLDNFTSSSGTQVSGSISETIDTITSTFVSHIVLSGSGSDTLEEFTSDASGNYGIPGTVSETFEDFTGVASGNYSIPGTGVLNLSNFTSAAHPTGSADVTTEAFTSTGSGEMAFAGSGSPTLEDFASTGAGDSVLSGSSLITLESFSSDASGNYMIDGSGNVIVQDFLASAKPVGSGNTTLASFTSTAEGDLKLIGGSGNTLGAFTSTGSGSSVNNATADVTTEDFSTDTTSNILVTGSLSETLASFTGFGTDDPNIAGSLEETVDNFTAISSASPPFYTEIDYNFYSTSEILDIYTPQHKMNQGHSYFIKVKVMDELGNPISLRNIANIEYMVADSPRDLTPILHKVYRTDQVGISSYDQGIVHVMVTDEDTATFPAGNLYHELIITDIFGNDLSILSEVIEVSPRILKSA